MQDGGKRKYMKREGWRTRKIYKRGRMEAGGNIGSARD